jgi:hypothetical protein
MSEFDRKFYVSDDSELYTNLQQCTWLQVTKRDQKNVKTLLNFDAWLRLQINN